MDKTQDFFRCLSSYAEFLGIVCLITTVINTFKDLEDCTTLHKQFASLYVKANSSGAIHTAWTKDKGMETPNYFGNQLQIKIKCSVGPETSISPREKGQGLTSFSERGLFFSEIGQLSDRA